MKGLRKKLKDQSGASILLALLFFLLCSMVGASVLMAAVSNAGKAHSNREEQRKYLLLSSALRLVCDELTEGNYTGVYSKTLHTVAVPKKDADGNVITDSDGNVEVAYTYTYHKYERKQGAFDCGLSGVLPLLPELEYIFAHKFPPGGSGLSGGDDVYDPLYGGAISAPKTHNDPHRLTLSVDAPDANGLGGDENKVAVTLWVDETNYYIWLTATLGEGNNACTMEAQLTSQGGDPGFADAPSSEAGIEKQVKVTWTLAWIAKKEAGNDA